ncbi:MAG: hypothetical protein MEP57_03150 [Microvirga sp.]|nr:hypothetical protein [Microvirga sp.]
MSGKSDADDAGLDFDVVMRRHSVEVLPQARELAMSVFRDLTRAARLVRGERAMADRAAYVFSPAALLRKADENP